MNKSQRWFRVDPHVKGQLVVIALAFIGCKSSAEKICGRAAERYSQCIGEMLGPEARKMVDTKVDDGVPACARSDKTVAMYRECLDKPTCSDFENCMNEFAMHSSPTVDPAAPRHAQCAQHVANSERGLAMEIAMTSGITDAEKQKTMECLSEDTVVAASCLAASGKAELSRRSSDLAKECETWSAEVAACKMKLPSAHDCDLDAEPESPGPDLGPAGPAIAWSATLAEDDSFGGLPLGWASDHALVLGDAKQLRVMRDNKELWHMAKMREVVVVGSRVVVDDNNRLRVLDGATGNDIATPFNQFVYRISAVGSHALVYADQDKLYDLDVQHCTAKRCPLKELAALGEESLVGVQPEATAAGTLLIALDAALLLDRRNKPRLRITLDVSGTNHLTATSDGLAIADDDGVALLSLPACAKLGSKLWMPATAELDDGSEVPESCQGCTLAAGSCIATHVAVPGGPREVSALSHGGVAFNDHADDPQTHVVTAAHSWSTPTGGEGQVATDENNVYTVVRHGDSKTVSVVALVRDNGQPRWHVDLPGATSVADARVEVRDGYLAARAGDRVFVIELPVVSGARR
jgi:hypothetical protein